MWATRSSARLASAAATLAVLLAVAGPAWGQSAGDTTRPHAPADRPCLIFAFGTWTPPLDWQSAGHEGSADRSGAAARRLRDSIFLQNRDDAGAARDGMMWDDASGGTRLLLFPWWWPAGILVHFDTTTLAADTLRGTAEAMVADASHRNPTATVRALRRGCASR